MITTLYPQKSFDDACILNIGDHDFIKHQSYLLYRMADTIKANKITKYVDKNFYIPKADFSPKVFNRITDGLYNSDNTRNRIIEYAKINKI